VVITSPGRGAKYGDEYVGLSVPSHNLKTTWPNFTKFLCMLPVAVVQFSSDGIAIHYVIPVLWITSCFHIMAPWLIIHRESKKGDTILLSISSLNIDRFS